MEKIDTQKLTDCINQMNSIIKEIENNFNTIKNLTNNVSSSWSGVASTEYISKSKKLTAEFDEYVTELKNCKLFLNSIVNLYAKTDDILLYRK